MEEEEKSRETARIEINTEGRATLTECIFSGIRSLSPTCYFFLLASIRELSLDK